MFFDHGIEAPALGIKRVAAGRNELRYSPEFLNGIKILLRIVYLLEFVEGITLELLVKVLE